MNGVAICAHAGCNHPWTAFDTWVIVGLNVAVALLIVGGMWFHRRFLKGP